MIRYSLKCDAGHGFESWFASAEGFDRLALAGQLACPACGSARVTKGLMAPAVQPARGVRPDLMTPQTEAETALAAMRRQVEENSDYVGMNFVTEARRIHAGDAPERAIHGEARMDEARALLDDGVPVAPLPFMPARRTN